MQGCWGFSQDFLGNSGVPHPTELAVLGAHRFGKGGGSGFLVGYWGDLEGIEALVVVQDC